MPHTLFGGYAGYIATWMLAAPYFTTQVTKMIELRLDLDVLNRPVFFFSKYHEKNGFHYDPFRKHILEYPESIYNLSKQKYRLKGKMVIEYRYKKAASFWLTHIGGYPVRTNRIDGSFIPPRLAVIKDDG